MPGTYGAMAVDYPDVFKGSVAVRDAGVPYLTGTAFSSHAPANWYFQPMNLVAPLPIVNIYVYKSMNAVVPGATNQASTGSEVYSYRHGVSIFSRQDNGANSTNLSCVKTGSGGLTATLSYAGTGVGGASQTLSMNWVTDTTGGVSNFSTTSGAGNWSSYVTGVKLFPIPVNVALSAGEWFIAHQHSSTTATSNSNVTLLSFSNLHVAPILQTYGVLGQSSASMASLGGPYGIGFGVASAVTTNATMPASVISASVANSWVQNCSAI